MKHGWIFSQLHPRTDVEVKDWDVVGAICETGDFLGKERELGDSRK